MSNMGEKAIDELNELKPYNIYLDVLNLEATSKGDAKKKFWIMVDRQRDLLSLEVEESDEERGGTSDEERGGTNY